MGAQFSEEFLLGYRAGHRDGFADAVLLMRDAVTAHLQARALARREAQLTDLLYPGEDAGARDEGERVATDLTGRGRRRG
ncbi:MAG TPA: hypothetical protein VIG69_08445 [Candidatus Methylomirabilis sp.]|jgi:hypothetical protein